MIKINFDFTEKIVELDEIGAELKQHLFTQLTRLELIANEPLKNPPVPEDRIKWAHKLLMKCKDTKKIEKIEKHCPRILNYLTSSPSLKEYMSDDFLRHLLVGLSQQYSRQRIVNNFLQYYFDQFSTIETSEASQIDSLVSTHLKSKPPYLSLTKFYKEQDLSLLSSKQLIINTILEQGKKIHLFNKLLPQELKTTSFFRECLITLSLRIHQYESNFHDAFWVALQEVNLKSLSTICVSNYILKVESESKKEIAKNKAMLLIADPSKRQLWLVEDEFGNYQKEVDKARQRLELWINEQYISAFFMNMSASNRGKFWLKHLKHIVNVRILGSGTFLNKMKRSSPSASQYLDDPGRFKKCGYNSDACIYIQFKNHTIILFENEGKAAIARKNDDPNFPEFKYYSNASYIINGKLQLAFKRSEHVIYEVKSHGRMIHFPGWEDYFDTWLKKEVL